MYGNISENFYWRDMPEIKKYDIWKSNSEYAWVIKSNGTGTINLSHDSDKVRIEGHLFPTYEEALNHLVKQAEYVIAHLNRRLEEYAKKTLEDYGQGSISLQNINGDDTYDDLIKKVHNYTQDLSDLKEWYSRSQYSTSTKI
jgi:hypothetical protein